MRRYGKLFATLAIGMVVMMSAVDFAEARRAGSGFGSRGTRTFDSAPATRTAPAPAAPIERTMTPQSQATRPAAAPNATTPTPARNGIFGGLGGGLMGGLLMGGLFGMLLGTGFGGGFGFLGLIFQGILIALLIGFLMRMFARRQQPATPGAGYSARQDMSGGAGQAPFQMPRMGGAAAAQARPKNPDEIGISNVDLDRFESMLKQLQAAYAAEDYATLRKITTPEAMSYLAEELSENATKGLKNDVRDVHLVQGDVAESWREGPVDYATVAMRYEAIDVMRDRATGQVVEGDPDKPSESVELWTFTRKGRGEWLVSAIQGAN